VVGDRHGSQNTDQSVDITEALSQV
jgi:hypothetical protein